MHMSFVPMQEILKGSYVNKKVAMRTCEISKISFGFISFYFIEVLKKVFADEH